MADDLPSAVRTRVSSFVRNLRVIFPEPQLESVYDALPAGKALVDDARAADLVGRVDGLADHAQHQILPRVVQLLLLQETAFATRRPCGFAGSSHSGLIPFLKREKASTVRSVNFFLVLPSKKNCDGLGMWLKWFQKSSTVANSPIFFMLSS